jgi:pimeloyl-ACP methyl ester carboxylesterase
MRTPRSGVRVEDTDVPAESTFVDLRDVHLHAVLAGPEDGPPVVLLHGFPEFWYGWHRQIAPLAEAGFRVIVPDQRGYNLSEKPAGVRSYRIGALARDVAGLIDRFGAVDDSRGNGGTGAESRGHGGASADGGEPDDGRDAGVEGRSGVPTAHVVGHDWGGAVAWWVALHHPERVRRLCAANVPHPTVLARRLRSDPDQQLRSWYTLFFQLPRIPEATMRAGNWALPARTMRESSLPGTFSEADFERYRAAWRQPAAFESMLNWYRAAGRERPTPRRTRVASPTLVLWGARDEFLATGMARESVARCASGRLELVADATHWVQHERPTRVAEALASFLRG